MKKITAIMTIIMLVFILGACGASPSTKEKETGSSESGKSSDTSGKPVNMTWAAGSLGGGWYSMAGGIASIIKEKNPNINIKVIPGGSLQNIPFLDQGQAQIAWEQPAFVIAGVNGEEPFKSKSPDLVAVGNGFGVNYFHFAVGEDTGINSIEEIFKKKMPIKIAVTPVNNSDEWVFRKFLEYYGVTYKDIKSWGGDVFFGSYTEQSEQFKNKNVDAVFAQLSLPGSSITESSTSRKMKVLPMSDDVIEHLSKYAISKGTIPAGTYSNLVNGNEDIQTAVMGNILVASKKVPEDVIYEITKIINESKDRLPSIHASLKEYSPEKAINDLGTTLHPGAEKYYKEAGIIK